MGPEELLRLIRDLMEPCICPGRGGHTDRACAWYDLPERAARAARQARQLAIHRQVAQEAVDTLASDAGMSANIAAELGLSGAVTDWQHGHRGLS